MSLPAPPIKTSPFPGVPIDPMNPDKDGVDIYSDLLTSIERVVGSGRDDTLTGSGSVTLDGGAGSDLLVAESSGVVLLGGVGDDTLDATFATGGFADYSNAAGGFVGTIGSGEHLDVIDGDGGRDVLINIVKFVGSNNADTIFGTAENNNLDIDGNKGNDSITGSDGNDTLSGGDGNDTLFGAVGNDALSGGNGDDALNGAEGDDQLIGDAGADIFAFSKGMDTISDFNLADGDRVDLTYFQITNYTDLGNAVMGGNNVDPLLLDFGNGDVLVIEGQGFLASVQHSGPEELGTIIANELNVLF